MLNYFDVLRLKITSKRQSTLFLNQPVLAGEYGLLDMKISSNEQERR